MEVLLFDSHFSRHGQHFFVKKTRAMDAVLEEGSTCVCIETALVHASEHSALEFVLAQH